MLSAYSLGFHIYLSKFLLLSNLCSSGCLLKCPSPSFYEILCLCCFQKDSVAEALPGSLTCCNSVCRHLCRRLKGIDLVLWALKLLKVGCGPDLPNSCLCPFHCCLSFFGNQDMTLIKHLDTLPVVGFFPLHCLYM